MSDFNFPPIDEIVRACRGRSGGLRPSKPTKASGLIKFIWRMARFDSGHDPTMPIVAYFDLSAWTRKHAPEANVSGIINDEGRRLLDEVDELVDQVLREFGLSKFGAAKRWKGLL